MAEGFDPVRAQQAVNAALEECVGRLLFGRPELAERLLSEFVSGRAEIRIGYGEARFVPLDADEGTGQADTAYGTGMYL